MAKKTKKVLHAGRRGGKTTKAKAPKRATKRKVTRQTALPGMEQVRNAKLDRICENIGESRTRKNEAIADEAGDSQAGLREMHDKNITHYTHAGVELILRRGADKLSVKLLKDKTSEGVTATPAADEGTAEDTDVTAENGDIDTEAAFT